MGDIFKETVKEKYNGYDLMQIVRDSFGQDVSDQVIEYFLWNATAFPFAGEEYMRKQVEQLAVDSGRDIEIAVDLAYEELVATMLEWQQIEKE